MSKSKPPLYPSHEKIGRAERKLRQFTKDISSFVASQPHSVRSEIILHRVYIIARRDKEPSIDLAFDVIETVKHIRESLDKMAVAMVRRNGRGTSGVGFPFGGLNEGKADPFPGPRHEALKKKLTPAQWDFIIAQKPYPGGDNVLWSVNELANADKHWDVLVDIEPGFDPSFALGPSGRPTLMRNIRISAPKDNSIFGNQKGERVLASFDAAGINPHIDCSISEKVVFGPSTVLHGKEVIPTVNAQLKAVKIIIGEADRLFF